MWHARALLTFLLVFQHSWSLHGSHQTHSFTIRVPHMRPTLPTHTLHSSTSCNSSGIFPLLMIESPGPRHLSMSLPMRFAKIHRKTSQSQSGMEVLPEYSRNHSISSTRTTLTMRAWVRMPFDWKWEGDFRLRLDLGKYRGIFKKEEAENSLC